MRSTSFNNFNQLNNQRSNQLKSPGQDKTFTDVIQNVKQNLREKANKTSIQIRDDVSIINTQPSSKLYQRKLRNSRYQDFDDQDTSIQYQNDNTSYKKSLSPNKLKSGASKLRETLEQQEREKVQTQFHQKGYDCVFEECNCKEIEKSKEQLRTSSHSPKPLISQFQKQRHLSNVLSNPFKPCRRCCSTNHNPFKHHLRILPKQKKRQNMQSTTKLIIAQTKLVEKMPERPHSQDSGMRRKERDLQALDWANTQIYKDILASHRQNYYNKDDDRNSILNTKFKQVEDDIYTETEVQFHSSILKKKQHSKDDLVPADELHEIFNKSLRTLKSQMKKLLLQKTFEAIKEQYQTSQAKETINNCIKLLLRCKKMYEAEISITKILRQVISREKQKDKLEHFIENRQLDHLSKCFDDMMILSSKILFQIDTLANEHRNFKRQFIFNKSDYTEQIQSDAGYYSQTLKEEFKIEVQRTLDKQGFIIDSQKQQI
eukprot:403360325